MFVFFSDIVSKPLGLTQLVNLAACRGSAQLYLHVTELLQQINRFNYLKEEFEISFNCKFEIILMQNANHTTYLLRPASSGCLTENTVSFKPLNYA